MSKGVDILNLIFAGKLPAWNKAKNLQVNLHSSPPGDSVAGVTTYGGYSPVTVTRAWGVFSPGNPVVNVETIEFPVCKSGKDSITHVSISPEGFDQVLYVGQLEEPLQVSPGIQPEFKAGSLEFMEI